MRLGREYVCIDEKGRVKVLTSTIKRSEVCFTDGKEYYFLEHSEYQYGDNIISYSPYGWKEPIMPFIIFLLSISLLWFLIGCAYGVNKKTMEHVENAIYEQGV